MVMRIGQWCSGWLAFWLLCVSAHAAEVVIGQVAPLSGISAFSGQQAVLGGKIYFEHVNDQGGVHGARIRHKVLDDGYQATETLRQTQALLAQPEVVALFGFVGTATVAPLLEQRILERAGIALVAPYSGGIELRTPFNPWIFHIRASYVEEVERMVQLTTVGMTRLAVVYQNDSFGKAGLASVQAALARRGLELVGAVPYERNTTNVAQAAAAIKNMPDVQAVIVIAVSQPAAHFVKSYRQLGGYSQLYGISVVNPQVLLETAGLDYVRGMGLSQVVPYPFRPNLPVVREYLELLEKYAPGAEANYTSFEQFLGAKVLVEALRRAGPAPSRTRVFEALESLRNFDLGGIIIRYAPNQRSGSHFVEMVVVGAEGKLFK